MSDAQPSFAPVRVLLVDDDSGLVNVLSRRLSWRGLAVRTAGDGGEAFAMVEAETFDVVLLDVGLPDVDGMQLLKAIKRSRAEIEIIVLTGGGTGSLESFRAGAFDLLHKPIQIHALVDAIDRAARAAVPQGNG